jgi:hypothetical protein
VAWSGLKTLARRQGPERCRKFLRAVLGAKTTKDLRALLRERAKPLDRVLHDEAGEGLQPFFSQWQAELELARAELKGELERVPRLHGEVVFILLSADSRKVHYRARIERMSAPDARYSMLYHLLPAFDEEVGPKSIQREQNGYAERPEDELPETYSRGGRLYWTLALDAPALGCQVISGWKRQEIK